MFRPQITSMVLCCLAWFALPASADIETDTLEAKRELYRDAKTALKQRQYSRFNRILAELDDYVLRDYLRFEYIKNRIHLTPKLELRQFIKNNQDTPLGEALQERWLTYLVTEKDWYTFLQNYDGVNDRRLQCHRLNHLIEHSYEQLPLMQEVEQLWLTGRRLPKECNPVFKAWQKAGHMTEDLVWARIKLAMDSRRISLMRELRFYLPQNQRKWVQRWEAVHWNPQRELKRISFPVETPVARNIIKHGIVRMGYRDPQAAMELWEKLKNKYHFFAEDENHVMRTLGILAAQKHLPEALDWLSQVSASADDDNLRIWRVKAALRAEEWETARHFITGLPKRMQDQTQWQYWRARVEEQGGRWGQAEPMYAMLARERSYYGFLAADRLDMSYVMQHKSVEVSEQEIERMSARRGVAAARELYYLGDIVRARRQWNWLTRNMNNRELQVAAVLARSWGWYDRAIFTVNKSDHLDDLELRFPVLYRDLVEESAERTGIEPEWIYGVMRQESAFVEDARSPAGALGLMQLMPRTGRQVGRKLNMRIRSNATILKIENNLILGASYLQNVLKQKGGSQVLATAAYNAGPHRVKRWLPEHQTMAADVWVDTIPYDETRHYVKNVLGYTAVYEHRLGENPTRLFDRMPVVEPR